MAVARITLVRSGLRRMRPYRLLHWSLSGLPWGFAVLAWMVSSPLSANTDRMGNSPAASRAISCNLHDVEFSTSDSWAVAEDASFVLPDSSQRALGLSADVLIWTVREGGAENWAQMITPQGLLGTYAGSAQLVDAPFEWNTGLRIGFGSPRIDDGWDARIYYTHFNTSATGHAAGEVYSAFLGNFYVDNTDGDSFGPHYRSASIRWDFQYHTLDCEISRSAVVAPNLIVHPFAGIKAAWIDQTLRSQWRHPISSLEKIYLFSSAIEDVEQEFWGIGPSLGVKLEVPLHVRPGYTLSLFGTPSGALMYGHWEFRERYANDGPTSLTVLAPTSISINSSPISGAATMVGGAMGIEWTRRFAHVTTRLQVAYETQVWLNQMQFYSYNMGRLNNLTSIHGGVLEFCLNY